MHGLSTWIIDTIADAEKDRGEVAMRAPWLDANIATTEGTGVHRVEPESQRTSDY
jgi:hypothetical protein